jgi:hypothetical protein
MFILVSLVVMLLGGCMWPNLSEKQTRDIAEADRLKTLMDRGLDLTFIKSMQPKDQDKLLKAINAPQAAAQQSKPLTPGTGLSPELAAVLQQNQGLIEVMMLQSRDKINADSEQKSKEDTYIQFERKWITNILWTAIGVLILVVVAAFVWYVWIKPGIQVAKDALAKTSIANLTGQAAASTDPSVVSTLTNAINQIRTANGWK